jgi:hypothetical protein
MIQPSDAEFATLSDVVRNYIEDLEAIAQRAGDVKGMENILSAAQDTKVPLAEFIVRCLTT